MIKKQNYSRLLFGESQWVNVSELYIYIWSKNFSHLVNEKSEAK
jgi:hypothetical protein